MAEARRLSQSWSLRFAHSSRPIGPEQSPRTPCIFVQFSPNIAGRCSLQRVVRPLFFLGCYISLRHTTQPCSVHKVDPGNPTTMFRYLTKSTPQKPCPMHAVGSAASDSCYNTPTTRLRKVVGKHCQWRFWYPDLLRAVEKKNLSDRRRLVQDLPTPAMDYGDRCQS